MKFIFSGVYFLDHQIDYVVQNYYSNILHINEYFKRKYLLMLFK